MNGRTKGEWIHVATADSQQVRRKSDGLIIAYVVEDETYLEGCDVAEAEANARIIAAAPEMYEALRECARVINGSALQRFYMHRPDGSGADCVCCHAFFEQYRNEDGTGGIRGKHNEGNACKMELDAFYAATSALAEADGPK